MSGRRIDDHSSWVGKSGKGMVFPEGSKHKEVHSAEGAGHMDHYPDTTEAIHKAQMHGDSKIRGHKMKEGYRY